MIVDLEAIFETWASAVENFFNMFPVELFLTVRWDAGLKYSRVKRRRVFACEIRSPSGTNPKGLWCGYMYLHANIATDIYFNIPTKIISASYNRKATETPPPCINCPAERTRVRPTEKPGQGYNNWTAAKTGQQA